jgi:hypothetical protein
MARAFTFRMYCTYIHIILPHKHTDVGSRQFFNKKAPTLAGRCSAVKLRNIQQRKHHKHHLKALLQLISRYNHQFKETKGTRVVPPALVDPNSKLVINFISLNIHPVSKINLDIHKKKRYETKTTNGRGMKPKLQGGGSMAIFSAVPHLITVLNLTMLQYH